MNGVKVDRTLYLNLKNNPVLAYTFFNPISEDKISDNLLITANQDNKLYLYTSRAGLWTFSAGKNLFGKIKKIM